MPSRPKGHALSRMLPPLCLAAILLAGGCARPAAPPVAASQTASNPNARNDALDRAEALLEDGPDQDPQAALALLGQSDAARARLDRAEAMRLLGRTDEAVAEANRLILAGRNTTEAFVTRARALYDAGASGRALEDLTTALRLEPKNLDALLTQGDIFFAMELPRPAELSYTKAIEAAPDDPLGYIDRGVVRDDQGRFAEAIADFDRAIALDPDSATAFANRGVTRSQLGDFDGMCADYGRACDLGQCDRLLDAHRMGYCGKAEGK